MFEGDRPQHRAGARVLMVNERMDFYRIPFYEALRAELMRRDIDLEVVYGRPPRQDAQRESQPELSWGAQIDNRYFHLGSRHLTWQPCMPLARRADLVIVEQATKRLLNYLLLARQLAGRGAVAFWGHGRNFKSSNMSHGGEWIKRRISSWPHWWFAYNDLSARAVQQLGYPSHRITSVQNAIDTRGLREAKRRVDPEAVERLRKNLGLAGRHVGIYCGSIYPEKRPEFTIEAARAVRAAIPDFELLVIGDGVSSNVLLEAASQHSWIHFIGPRFADAKLPYFALAHVYFLPGLVGLAVLDSFALEVPMVASRSAEHSPEIDYLQHDFNGLLVEDGGSPQVYADAVAALLTNDEHRRRLSAGCRASRDRYTIEAMSQRFAAGIAAALQAPPFTALRLAPLRGSLLHIGLNLCTGGNEEAHPSAGFRRSAMMDAWKTWPAGNVR